ncbi:Cyclin CCL1 [Candida viswanathii]|uniref:Cyclin CCL1 n=1 Tax=Candida viswanathii TaxID=5486 RepID=A0A367XS92_9ASCO|nr:Cyclin CCL1 [Candida viswanathii]
MTDSSKSPEVSEPPAKKPRISNDDLYRNSTQFELWSFTPDNLKEAKRRANEKGIQVSKEKFDLVYAQAKHDHPDVFQQYPDELNPSMRSFLTPDEESTYLDFYIQNITTTCNFFKMPTQVRLTAASFFKKFYLVNSVMEFHPKNVLYTCIFLAAKSENYFISIESYVKALKGTDAAHILDLEFIVLRSLKFTLLVHHPIRPLYGFFLDFQAVLLHPEQVIYDVNVDTLGKLYNEAKEWLNKYFMVSDVAFLFTPPQIALAAMYDTDKRITERYLKRKFLKDEPRLGSIKEEPKEEEAAATNGEEGGGGGGEVTEEEQPKGKSSNREQYESLVKSIRRCIKIAKQSQVADREASKEIDKKCFFALNPKKLIDKRIKRLTSGAADGTKETTAEPK